MKWPKRDPHDKSAIEATPSIASPKFPPFDSCTTSSPLSSISICLIHLGLLRAGKTVNDLEGHLEHRREMKCMVDTTSLDLATDKGDSAGDWSRNCLDGGSGTAVSNQ
ncbi:hypothetical protein C1H46_002807 [Malus baccata]|uniref:Uncharacterized protein n=1 Tax=Malus baccata TaxID=106549 RepID=A0A540NKR2_MALBA|nr:hypothetical protein C1H46_002807 [Malus baccata]